jgi:hypothetical protein
MVQSDLNMVDSKIPTSYYLERKRKIYKYSCDKQFDCLLRHFPMWFVRRTPPTKRGQNTPPPKKDILIPA